MAKTKNDDFDLFLKPVGRAINKPLGVSNTMSTYDRDRKGAIYGSLPDSPPGATRKRSLFRKRCDENDESLYVQCLENHEEVSTKAPIVIPVRTSISSYIEAPKPVVIKPRRSMLGRRSKINLNQLPTDDSTYTLPKATLSSTPIIRNPAPLARAASSPALNNPFDTDDVDSSDFFSRVSSSSTWSVFKSKKDIDPKKVKNCPQETPLSSGPSKFVSNSSGEVRGTLDSHSHALKNQPEREEVAHESRSSNETKKSSDQKMLIELLTKKYSQPDSVNGPRKSVQRSVEEPTAGGYSLRPRGPEKKVKPPPSGQPELLEATSPPSHFSEPSLNNSTDSYMKNEADIEEEKSIPESNSAGGLSNQDIVSNQDNSDEYLSIHEDDETEPLNLLEKIKNLKKRQEKVDIALMQYLEEKEKFEKELESIMTEIQSQNNPPHLTSAFKKKKVIVSKIKPYSPSVSVMKLKRDFKVTKSALASTPLQSSKQMKFLRKSLCYTPNSLSTAVKNQVKDIFGD